MNPGHLGIDDEEGRTWFAAEQRKDRLVAVLRQDDHPLRYDENAHELLFFAGNAESGQNRMGNPPWADLWRYLRNSPLNYVDRVETPLMIVQGDMDYVPIQQGEEFFTAVYRLGKPAEFVRYWGEGHVISSPANTRDMWQRIFGWLDEYLKGGKMQEDSTAAPTAVH